MAIQDASNVKRVQCVNVYSVYILYFVNTAILGAQVGMYQADDVCQIVALSKQSFDRILLSSVVCCATYMNLKQRTDLRKSRGTMYGNREVLLIKISRYYLLKSRGTTYTNRRVLPTEIAGNYLRESRGTT